MSFLCTATMKHELCKYRGYIKAINLNLNLCLRVIFTYIWRAQFIFRKNFINEIVHLIIKDLL